MFTHIQGLVNVPIEHHPSVGDIISNRYLKVMFKIPKKGHLPTPDIAYIMGDVSSLDAITGHRSPGKSQEYLRIVYECQYMSIS